MKDIKRVFDKIESIVLVLSIIGVFFLVIQLGFITDMEMPVFNEEYSNNNGLSTNKEVGYIIIKNNRQELNDFEIRINGKGKFKFDANNEVTLKVYDGDTIQVDNSSYNEDVELIIVGISKNIQEPKLNEKMIIKKGIKTFLEVKIK